MRKKWVKPMAVIFAKSTQPESPLAYCKSSISSINGDPSIYRAKCDGKDATCFACYQHLVNS